MGLRKLTIPVSFQAGVDTGTDPKVQGQALLKAENAVFPRKGAVGKRQGTLSLSGTHTEPHLASFRSRPVAIGHNLKVCDGASIDSGVLATAATLSLWETELKRTQVPEGEQRYNAEVLEVGSVRVWSYLVYNASGPTYDLHLETYERYSGRLLDSSTLTGVAGGDNQQCRLINLDGGIFYLYVFNTNIWIGEVDPSAGTIAGAIDTLITGYTNNEPFDAVAVNTTHIMACGRDSTGNNLRVASLDPNGASYSSTTLAAVDVDAVGIWERQTDEAVVGFFLGASRQLRFVAYDIGLAGPTVANTQIRLLPANTVAYNITGACQTADTADMFYTQDETVHSLSLVEPRVYRADLDLAALSASDGVILNKAVVASKPHDDQADSGDLFLWVTYEDQGYAYLIDQDGNHRGKALPAQVQGSTSMEPVATWFISSMANAATALRYKPDTGNTRAPVMVTITRPAALHCLELAEQLQIPGSIPVQFDGEDVTEVGYLHVPKQVGGAAAGGGNLSAGDYRAVVVYEDRDTGNILHVSAPSNPSDIVTSGAGGTITWTIPYLTHTLRSNVTAWLYRTNADKSKYYRHPRSETVNNSTLDQFQFIDGPNAADDDLSAEAELYTAGDALPNTQPPQSAVQGGHQERQFFVHGEHPGTHIRYSKPLVEGLGPEHNDSLFLTVPPSGGDITAIFSFMGRLVVSKEARMYAVGGAGYTNTLRGNGYGAAQLVSEAIGVANQKTVALVPGGVMFQGADRIWLLAKNWSLTPIGDPVRYWTDPKTRRAGGPLSLVKAVHMPKLSLVVFFSSDGGALVYNYLYGLWSTWTNHEATDACRAGDDLVFKAGLDDTVRLRDDSTFADDGDPVVLAIETGNLSFAGIGGYKRLYELLLEGQNITSHTLHVLLAFDKEPTWLDDLTFDSSTLTRYGAEAHMGDGATDYEHQGYQLRVCPSRQKCTAVRVHIYDDDHTGSNESYDVSALTFEVGLKKGTARRGPSRRMAP